MSWLFKKRKDGKFAWWTTISDGWMTEPKWLDRDKMVRMVIALKRKEFNKEMKEIRKTFPKGFYGVDGKMFFD